jgi:hypothetical protein
MDLSSLKTELTTDPAGLGYAGKSHEEIAALLSKLQRTVNRDQFSGADLASCIDPVERAALTASQKDWLQMLTSANGMLTLFASLRQDIRAVLATATKSLAKFNQTINRSGSRAEELGLGSVTTSDIADALRG